MPSNNWWVSNSGKNALLSLPDEYILDFIFRHPQARHDFDVLVPTMAQEEQDRLQDLIDRHPLIKAKKMRDPQEVSDAIQSKHNRAGVRTRKPRRR